MKKLSLLLLCILVLMLRAEAKKVEGKIIFQNDTLKVTFNIPVGFFTGEPNYEKLQYRVKYYDKDGKKLILRPDKAREIQFEHDNLKVRMLSRLNTIGAGNIFSTNSHIFLKLEIDGKLKLFNYYYTQHSGGMYNASSGTMSAGYSYGVEKYIMQKGTDILKWPKTLTFRKDMIEYFKDCPELVKMIESKEFRKGELQDIVNFYNSKCK